MTRAEFCFVDGNIISFSVKGHSGYSGHGSDIVCAAISSTVWMTVNALENILKLDVEYSQKEADVYFKVSECDALAAQDFLKGLEQFLCNLSYEYGDYLAVKEVQKNV